MSSNVSNNYAIEHEGAYTFVVVNGMRIARREHAKRTQDKMMNEPQGSVLQTGPVSIDWESLQPGWWVTSTTDHKEFAITFPPQEQPRTKRGKEKPREERGAGLKEHRSSSEDILLRRQRP